MSSDPRTAIRRYSDKEVTRLLTKAAEIQEEEAGHELEGRGMTLTELQEVAAEAGIHPRYLQQAAARIDHPGKSGLGAALAGTPLTITVEREVPGTLLDEDFERAVMDIQRAFSGTGAASMVGRTLMWKSEGMDHETSLQVTVTSRGGETRILAEERFHNLAAVLHFGVVVGAGTGIGLGVGMSVGMAVLASPLFAALFPLGVIGGLYTSVRHWLKKKGIRRRRELEQLVDRIAAYAQTGALEPGGSGSEALPPGAEGLPGGLAHARDQPVE